LKTRKKENIETTVIFTLITIRKMV